MKPPIKLIEIFLEDPDISSLPFACTLLSLIESIHSPDFSWQLYASECLQELAFFLGCCGSVDWVLACEPKGSWFDSQSGHMPGLQARSPVRGTREASTHWCFSPSLAPSLLLCLKISKWNLKKSIEYFTKNAFLHVVLKTLCSRHREKIGAKITQAIPPQFHSQ